MDDDQVQSQRVKGIDIEMKQAQRAVEIHMSVFSLLPHRPRFDHRHIETSIQNAVFGAHLLLLLCIASPPLSSV